MKNSLKKAIIISFFFYIIAFILVWYNDNFEEAISLTKEYWYVIVLLPVFLIIYSWFKGVKKKAFDLGAGIKRNKNGNNIN